MTRNFELESRTFFSVSEKPYLRCSRQDVSVCYSFRVDLLNNFNLQTISLIFQIDATCIPAAAVPSSPPISLSEYAQEFCKITMINSRFAVPVDLDSTNKRYVYNNYNG